MKPITVGRGRALPKKRAKYPWVEMGVGDDFFIPGYSTAKMRSLGGTISGYRRQHGMEKEFVTRKDCENDVIGIRVTRIK